jgi:hypothetical protein
VGEAGPGAPFGSGNGKIAHEERTVKWEKPLVPYRKKV